MRTALMAEPAAKTTIRAAARYQSQAETTLERLAHEFRVAITLAATIHCDGFGLDQVFPVSGNLVVTVDIQFS